MVIPPSQTVSSLSVTPPTLSVVAGNSGSQQLKVIATMGDGSTKDVTSTAIYTSSNKSVATVDTNGMITVLPTAAAGGIAKITAAYGGQSVASTVTVIQNPSQTVAGLTMDPNTANIIAGTSGSQQLKVTATMGDGSTKDVTSGSTGTTYTSTNPTAVQVDTNGLVTITSKAVVGAKYTITASNGGQTATSIISYIADPATVVSSMSINPSTVTLGQGDQKQLSVIATMKDGSTKDITSGDAGTTYTSSNTSAATVDANGLVTVAPTATNGAKTVISAVNKNVYSSCIVTVHYDVTLSSISVNPVSTTLAKGQQRQLIVTENMSDGTTGDVTNGGNGTIYTSSNTEVATVDSNGIVTVLPTANSGDKVIITISYNGKITTSEITVTDTVSYLISIDSKYVSYTPGKLVYGYVRDSAGNGVANETVYEAYYPSRFNIPADNQAILGDVSEVKTDKTGYYSFYVYDSGYYLACLSLGANSVREDNYVLVEN